MNGEEVHVPVSKVFASKTAFENIGKPLNRKCKYCQARGPMEGEMITDYTSAIDIMIDGVFLYAWCGCGTHIVKEIKYCPMCGRKLE